MAILDFYATSSKEDYFHTVSVVALLGAALGTLSGATPPGTATLAARSPLWTTQAPPPSPLVGPSLHWLCGVVFVGPGLLMFLQNHPDVLQLLARDGHISATLAKLPPIAHVEWCSQVSSPAP